MFSAHWPSLHAMIRLFLLVALVAALPAPAQAQEGPAITFESTTYDYGTIQRGSDGIATFPFTNTGTEPLIITAVNSPSGSAVPSWTTDPVPPGGTSHVSVRYDTQRVGPILKSVVVQSNAGVHPLRLKGQVEGY